MTMAAVKHFVFPAFASRHGTAGPHYVECVVPDYFAGLTAEEILAVLDRHSRYRRRGGQDIAGPGAALARAMGRAANGVYATGSHVSPEARDAALSDAIRDFHTTGHRCYAPDARRRTHAEWVDVLLSPSPIPGAEYA